MGILGTMTVNINANIAGLQSGINNAKNSIKDLQAPAMAVAGTIIGIGVAGAMAAAKTVQMAADFQSGMTSLVTGAGESASNIKMVSNGILDLAVKTGTSTKQLTDGMYMIESAGFHGAAGLQVLQSAAEGAKVGNADLGTVANAVTTILTDYHLSGDKAASATNALITTVAQGKTHMQDLASAMGAVLPLASALGISFPQVAGAIAVMTNAGMSAQHASQNLANSIRSLSAPNATAQKSMVAVGISAQQLKDTLANQGLPAALELIEDHVGKKFPAGSVQAVTAFKNIMGGATGYNVALMLGGKNMDAFKANVDTISKSMNAGGDSVQGWTAVQNTFNFKMQQAQEVLETTAIKIGTALIPVVSQLTNAFGFLVDVATNVFNFFNNNAAALDVLKVVVIALAGAIGGLLTAALYVAAVAAWVFLAPFLLNPVTLWAVAIGALIGLIAGGVILAMQHWGQIVGWLQGVWQGFLSWWSGFSSSFMGILSAIGSFFVSVWQGAVSAAISVWNGLKSAGSAVLSWFNTWKPVIEGVAGAITIFFLPAMIKAGVQAAISGAQIAAQFVKSMITAGVEATVNGAQVTAQFVKSIIQTGIQSVISGAQVTANFVKSMITSGIEAATAGVKIAINFVASVIKSGIEAAIAGGKIVVSFVSSLIATGLEGWGAAGKLGLYIASVIASGAQSVIAGGMIVASFVASLVSAGIEAIVSAGIFLATLVPSLLAVAAGVIAATWPFLLIAAVVAVVVVGVILAIQHWAQITAWFQGVWSVTWNAVSTFFTNAWNGILSFFQRVWNFIVNIAIIAGIAVFVAITGPIGLLVLYVITHWNQVLTFFQQFPGKAIGFLNALPGMIGNLWNTIITDATNAGANIVKGIADGINNAIHFVTGAITNVTSWISAHLPHSPAKVGPLRDLVLQGSMIPDQIATGMLGNQSKLNSAIAQLAKPISASLNISASSYPSGSSNNSAAILAAVASSASSTNNNQNAEFHIYLDSKEITAKVGSNMASAIRAKGVRSR